MLSSRQQQASAGGRQGQAQQQHGQQHGHGLDADKTVQKFKTKVCLFWLQPGGCPYGACLLAWL